MEMLPTVSSVDFILLKEDRNAFRFTGMTNKQVVTTG